MKRSELINLIADIGKNQAELSQLRRVASQYRPNADQERLIALREADRAAFNEAMTPRLRISLGYYENAKQAARVIEAIDQETTS